MNKRTQLQDAILAVKRLERSNTALTRKRARKAVRSAMGRLLKEYPNLDSEGNQRPAKARCVCVCPFCRVPIKSAIALWKHLIVHHITIRTDFGIHNINTVSKSYCPGCERNLGSYKCLVRHIAAVIRGGKIAEHFCNAVAKKSLGN